MTTPTFTRFVVPTLLLALLPLAGATAATPAAASPAAAPGDAAPASKPEEHAPVHFTRSCA